MLRIFCQNCGSKHEYTDLKPIFCCQCSASFDSSAPKPTLKPKVVISQTNDDDEDDGGEEVPEIEKLDVEVEVRRRKQTIADIVGTPKQEITREKPKKLTKKQFLEEFRREAGSIKNRADESREVQ